MPAGRLETAGCGFAQLAGHKEKVTALRAPRGTVASESFCNSGPRVVLKERICLAVQRMGKESL